MADRDGQTPDKEDLGIPEGADTRSHLARAREAESAWVEAREKVHDAATLRLFTVLQDLRPYVTAMPEARGFIDLALVPGYPPRLWIDLSAYVLVDETDGRTLRLVQETLEERRVLYSTRRPEDMTAFLKRFIAHRVARRHRLLAGEAPLEIVAGADSGSENAVSKEETHGRTAHSAGLLWLVWLAGVASGILLLALFLLLTGRLPASI